MRKTILKSILLLAAITSVYAGSPDDAKKSAMLVGEWQGSRHSTQYKADGTWRLNPLEGTTHGKWKIEDGKFIETWRFNGDPKDSIAVYDIVALNGKKFILRTKDGVTCSADRK